MVPRREEAGWAGGARLKLAWVARTVAPRIPHAAWLVVAGRCGTTRQQLARGCAHDQQRHAHAEAECEQRSASAKHVTALPDHGEGGDEGVERARQIKPDLVIMDVVMPGTNGYQATRALSRDDGTKNIPVIICTTKNQETDKLWGMRQGAQDYVTKPVDGPALLAKIAALG